MASASISRAPTPKSLIFVMILCYFIKIFYDFFMILIKIYVNFMPFAEKSAECYPPNDTKSKA